MKAKKTIVTLLILIAVSAGAVQLTTANSSNAHSNNKPNEAAAPARVHEKKNPDKKPPSSPVSANPKPSANAGTGSGTSTSITDQNGYTISLTGGYDTDSVDHGRPVVLIAAALGVPTEVFREAFSGVTPAGAGSDGPTSEQAQSNKAALLKVLAPYGISNDRLDEVSNYYRYNGSKGEVWTRTAATATTLLTNGKVTGIKITNAGAGYSSAPTITITGPTGTFSATATVSYTTDFKTNGSLTAIKLN
ncbi:hypothetical protein SAMN04487969_109223 [Paenibacillus algorifonticola]|uniref:Uncharacterized protein n=1 Tax=Paenibacillus algorifonticola TaxID=684063 RepID=A0A1I2ENC6_9BACL|nr:hypothetical protein [Paenibacillus algorifonticola]SFE93958.1 hypothetical protein SAMN04487969_109223 [Paenibacillus algorifonticola]